MLKRVIPVIALLVCYTQASDGQCSIELAPDQAQVHGLYSFDKDAELKRQNVTSALLICRVTPLGGAIMKQVKDMPLNVKADCKDPLKKILKNEHVK